MLLVLPSSPRSAHSKQRPINVDNVIDCPLGIIDASSCPRADLIAYDILYPDRVGGNYIIKPNQHHKWYYLSHQTPDEALVFKQYDSDASKVQYAPHSAFNNPQLPEKYMPRESIELRLFVFYEDEVPKVEVAKL